MAKVPMRVIPEPAAGTREVFTSKVPGSIAITGTEGSTSFLCGLCRAVLAKNVGPDRTIAWGEEDPPGSGEFPPLLTLRDVVFKCKGCGAFNEVARGS
jgi:hypothetical protein